MKTFIASGFGAGILWRTFFGEKKGGGSFASLVFVGIIYFLQLEIIWLLIIFISLTIIYFMSVDDISASNDPKRRTGQRGPVGLAFRHCDLGVPRRVAVYPVRLPRPNGGRPFHTLRCYGAGHWQGLGRHGGHCHAGVPGGRGACHRDRGVR